jgi:hypothetical protein
MMTNVLTSAINEKDVENTYRHNFLKKFKDMEITSPFGCDGFGVSKTSKVRTLMEFKDDVNLSNKTDLVKVLAQSVFYIKKFYDKGIIPPSTIFIGDRNECVAIHVNDIIKYLEMDLNWSIAPSQAHTIGELVIALMKDESINPFVYASNHFLDCIDKVQDLTDNVQRKVLVTDKNITEVFRYFDEKVLGKTKLTTNERANLFIQILVNKDDNYLHPVSKRKTVVTKSFGEVSIVSRDAFQSFFAHFASSYSPSQKHKLAAVVDRIIDDTTRRKQGEFFTPAIWVDKAHEYVASVFGEDWKEKYVVWDPAWGTGNLTRDYKFKELYVSTLNQSDIDTANQMGYNSEAVKFQYDFLNDDYEKLPVGLRNAIKGGKEIIVLMNPPYATSSNMNKVDDSKEGTTENMIQREMSKEKFSQAQKQLYTQFFWRLDSISSNMNIAFFSKPMFLTSEGFTDFRKKVLCKYGFGNGFLMNSNEFADTKSWGLSFSVWKKNSTESNFNFDVLVKNENLEIIKSGNKVFYNCDTQKSAGDWVREGLKKLKKIVKPNLSSSLTVSQKDKKTSEESFGTMNNNSNQIYKSGTEVFITTSPSSLNANVDILPFNLYKVISLFTVRKSIKMTWINEKDEYLAPNEESLISSNFNVDSIVYSLFNNGSQQSSLRQITYKDRLWDIKNEFFWMSVDKMKEIADQNGYDELYNDARTSPDRYVHKLIFGEERIYDKLSPDAKLVLDKATELVEKSMELRQVMANEENHLNSWDAGYAQLKLVWKEYFQEDFKEFRQLYKNLEDRMRPLVYELGFLKK